MNTCLNSSYLLRNHFVHLSITLLSAFWSYVGHIYIIFIHIYTFIVPYLSSCTVAHNASAMRETWVWSLGWEDLLEEGMATHSSILPGESPWTEEPGGLQSTGLQRIGHDWSTKHISPPQCMPQKKMTYLFIWVASRWTFHFAWNIGETQHLFAE